MAKSKRQMNQERLNATATGALQKTKAHGNKAVKYTRDELNVLLAQYYMIRDCIDGEPAIKGFIGLSAPLVNVGGGAYNGGGLDMATESIMSKARRYLPMPNPADQTPENIARYKSYLQRAVYYNVTSRTLEGMVGQVYLIEPVAKMPKQLEDVMKEDADGQGLSLIQLSKRAVRYTMAYGRAGILTDYPPTDGSTTAAQLEAGDIRPILTVYPPWDILNWRTKKRGVKTILSMIVLRERYDSVADDGFTVSPSEKYRVLCLDEETDVYTVKLYDCGDEAGDNDNTEPDIFTPKDANGNTFNTIPFTFIGAENNDAAVDKPPMYDLASLNIAHYRNSADYEESCFICGQPTPIVIGLSEEWYNNVLHKQITFGSRNGIPLPPDSHFELVQAKENSMPLEAMKLKEDQMVSIGAKLVIQKRVQKTATEAIVDSSSEQSVLTNVANNVSAAFASALMYAARFVGAITKDIQYKLNTSFELNRMTLDDVSKLIAVWQKGAITFGEMREGVRKSGLANLPTDEALLQIKDEIAIGLATGPVADPFGQVEAAAAAGAGAGVDPNSDPAGHAKEPATRNAK